MKSRCCGHQVGWVLLGLAVGLGMATPGFAKAAEHSSNEMARAESLAHYGDKDTGVPSCASCHGNNGEGQKAAGFPRLANLPKSYFKRQLDDFASGKRQNAMMSPIAKLLSPKQREALAQYYADMPTPRPVAGYTDKPASKHTLRLVHEGRWSENQPSCAQCHGDQGQGVGKDFPPLAGQSASYLRKQLKDWKNDKRDPGPLGLMGDIAKKLSDEEIDALAEYFATQAGQEGDSK